MKPVFETDAYFNAVPKEQNASLFVIREMIFNNFPNIKEVLFEGVPTYVLNGKMLCKLVSTQEYMILFFPASDLLLEFEEELEKYKWHRSKIFFNKIEEEDVLLFQEIMNFTSQNYHLSKANKQKTRTSLYSELTHSS